MSKKRNKIHKPGERLSVYLNKDLPDHFFEWIAKQDDVSAFVIYALEQLYSETGNKNVANMLPRRFHFEDTKASFPELTSNSPNTKSESIAIKNIEVPKEAKRVEQADAKEINEKILSSEDTSRIERDIQQPELVQVPEIVETITPEFEHDELKESEDNSLETNKWANLGNVDPDNF
ncbi:hypothetical protein V6B14_22225 (plasmid) [Sporosarcina psychrophila]|uniref:hypothetical protein n=1 Tax=Sporosarcina psychrophila TaxID=1476 RepID=UPI0030D00BF9